jgi:hypothetical protein
LRSFARNSRKLRINWLILPKRRPNLIREKASLSAKPPFKRQRLRLSHKYLSKSMNRLRLRCHLQ